MTDKEKYVRDLNLLKGRTEFTNEEMAVLKKLGLKKHDDGSWKYFSYFESNKYTIHVVRIQSFAYRYFYVTKKSQNGYTTWIASFEYLLKELRKRGIK